MRLLAALLKLPDSTQRVKSFIYNVPVPITSTSSTDSKRKAQTTVTGVEVIIGLLSFWMDSQIQGNAALALASLANDKTCLPLLGMYVLPS